jgi:hypothetical protein
MADSLKHAVFTNVYSAMCTLCNPLLHHTLHNTIVRFTHNRPVIPSEHRLEH